MRATIRRLEKVLEGTGITVEDFDLKSGVLTMDVDDNHISIVSVGSELKVEIEKR